MLQVNCAMVQKLRDKIDGLVLEDVSYKVKKIHALIMDVDCECDSEDKAKALLQKYLSELPEMQGRFLSIKITDEAGNIL